MILENINPVTIKTIQPFRYSLNSLINRIVEKDKQFFDYDQSEVVVKTYLDTILMPTLEFMQANDIHANIILTGKLVKYINNHKKIHTKMNNMRQKGLLKFVADCYYGESLVSFFNTNLWVESIEKTIIMIQEGFDFSVDIVFLPQIFRSLELEKLTKKLQITKFLTRKKGQKPDVFKIQLSEFRRFNGNEVSWIVDEADVVCEFYNISDNLFFEPNLSLLAKDIQIAQKAMNMEMGLSHTQYLLKEVQKTKLKQIETIRIDEKYSLYLYNHLQRAVIRLWEHGSMVLTSSGYKEDDPNFHLYLALAKLQSSFYLTYLEKKHYIGHNIPNFTSPYEAFVNMQSAIKEIEILIKNKI